MRTNKSITRRLTIAGMIGTASIYAFPVVALSKSDAEKLIERLTNDVLSAVNEQKSDKIMFV